jgi:hypothetical protein
MTAPVVVRGTRLLKELWWRIHDPSLRWRLNRIGRRIWGERSVARLPYLWEGGPERWHLIQALIEKHSYRSYLEIGCAGNACFDRIQVERKVGVDPVRGGTVRATSDEFFDQNRETFDCIFIDGLHTYEQVRRDLEGALSSLAHQGVIVLHDCLPCTIEEQAVPREQQMWTGDVWKAVVEIRTRPDLDAAVCRIDRGVGVVLMRPNSAQLSFGLGTDFRKLRYDDYVNNNSVWMRVISFDEVLTFVGGDSRSERSA